jgi:hypothetical protein
VRKVQIKIKPCNVTLSGLRLAYTFCTGLRPVLTNMGLSGLGSIQRRISCLKDDPHAFAFLKTLTPSHQHYFNSWISSAKTIETKEERLTFSVKALGQSKGYQQMRRENI